MFRYDEEGRLTKIEHDDGQSSDIRYEYQYTGDGVRYLKKDHAATKEYRYGCSIDCGGTPMRVYERTLGSQGNWTSVEDYVSAPTFVWYNDSSDYGWLPGHWLSALDPPGEGAMFYQDRFGVQVAGDFNPQSPAQEVPIIWDLMGLSVLWWIKCWRTATQVSADVDEWHNEHFRDKPREGFDKFKHCFANCLIGLDAGLRCAGHVAFTTERDGIGFVLGPLDPIASDGEIDDEIANLDGYRCARDIISRGSIAIDRFLPGRNSGTTGNNWLDCQSCCRSKGYRP
ncbi:MAG: hypothetical protein KIT45_15345 [Fimbriimonadia bacterium]|nr:hypothetical protein [Fimbriimonadia bacterium]